METQGTKRIFTRDRTRSHTAPSARPPPAPRHPRPPATALRFQSRKGSTAGSTAQAPGAGCLSSLGWSRSRPEQAAGPLGCPPAKTAEKAVDTAVGTSVEKAVGNGSGNSSGKGSGNGSGNSSGKAVAPPSAVGRPGKASRPSRSRGRALRSWQAVAGQWRWQDSERRWQAVAGQRKAVKSPAIVQQDRGGRRWQDSERQ